MGLFFSATLLTSFSGQQASKWFLRWHLWHLLPYAEHFSRWWKPPQNLHLLMVLSGCLDFLSGRLGWLSFERLALCTSADSWCSLSS